MSESSSSSDDEDLPQPSTNATSSPPTHLTLDLGLLAVFDPSPDSQNKGELVACVQTLIDELFALPQGKEGSKRVVALPEPRLRLPRQKPLPKPKVETKWETFAKSKGINTTKRERMLFDETTQEWKPRFGSQRAMNNAPILELKQTDPVDLNPFERKRTNEKLVQLKQKQRELKNKERAAHKSSANDLPVDVLEPGSKLGKKRTHERLKQAQVSTASHGRFDAKQKGEAPREIGDKRRKFGSNIPATDERARALKLLERL